jgi:hypothetical protein
MAGEVIDWNGVLIEIRPWTQRVDWEPNLSIELPRPTPQFLETLRNILYTLPLDERTGLAERLRTQLFSLRMLHLAFRDHNYALQDLTGAWYYDVPQSFILLREWIAICRSMIEILQTDFLKDQLWKQANENFTF